MSSVAYQILLIGDRSRTPSAVRMLEELKPVFSVQAEEHWQLAKMQVASAAFDAILVDPEPANNIADIVKNLRSANESVPVLVLISEHQKNAEEQALAARADDCLYKESLNVDLLSKSLRYVIENAKLRASLRQWERRFADLFENTRDILFTMDLDGNFLSVNKAAEEVTGWSREEALQKNIKCLIAPEHTAVCNEMMRRIANEQPLQHFEIAMLRKDGGKVLLETSARLLRSVGKKDAIQGIARDVTERRKLESMVRQSQKLEAIGRLSGGLAHDFNNLLCVISGHTELLAERLGLSDPASRNVSQIRKAADSAASLTRQLLAFSRKQVFHPQVVDLNAIVQDTERLLERLIDEHIEMYTALDPDLGHVRVDPVQIEQVIINLVLNARDAMPRGGKITIETSDIDLEEEHHSRHSIISAGSYVLLAITDTGCGMNDETQSRIFEPFYTTKEIGKGTGLGLATVYGIVKQSGGFLWVYSEEGRGTTFKVYLPRVASPLTDVRPGRNIEIRRGTETILVVEDAEPLRALTKEFLTASGYAVLEAANGDEGIRIAQSYTGNIDLLLTDVVMPRLGGKRLVELMAQIRPRTRVLYMSGYPNDGIVQAGILENGVALLEKPFTREILSKRVREVMDEPALAT